ncbi:DUF3107 domain-containing protein [Cellulomonas carbonis]|uniref:ATP-binding protein n=1 Tax=Cellulomonas carbonis T26 TaxID=947969 RepID=A0A0A0BLP6_9CELL|nr:DUF3107 domain-containing protein [Cellulomonas carbonis]KGM08612.1 ATP-binding protein [Cellulomonas carbonis T26]MDT0166510.1 DUF3107 domain-containing protein [Actinotalea sp. AC32]
MEITIGVQNVARELVVDTDRTADEVAAEVARALETGAPLQVTDTRGRRILVPSSTIGYVEIGGDEARRVGFHNL